MNSALIFSIISLGLLAGMNLVEYDVSYVKSTVDGQTHLVRNDENREQEYGHGIFHISLKSPVR